MTLKTKSCFQTTVQVLPNQILYCRQKKLREHYPPVLYLEWIQIWSVIDLYAMEYKHHNISIVSGVFHFCSFCVVLIFWVALILDRQRGTILQGLYWCHQKYSSHIVWRFATSSIPIDKTHKDTHTQTDIQRSSNYDHSSGRCNCAKTAKNALHSST